MARKGRARFRALVQLVENAYPHVDAELAIRGGAVRVDGRTATNPSTLVRADASIALRSGGEEPVLRGEAKLEAALDAFDVCVDARIALDLGASAGGFTRALVRRGASRVYAVDAGFGQLLGSLRQDTRVVNLERTNLGSLTTTLVPDVIDVVTADLSYLSLAQALPQQNGRVTIASEADLIALVKPQFELSAQHSPTDEATLQEAVRRAVAGASAAGWNVAHVIRSPLTGSKGATEFFLHGRLARNRSSGQFAAMRVAHAPRDDSD
jgi:23S rRNA (cytidine1920-2'-O)/16S rRNA (cytidine1409-2'-O)-methyltransferase